MSDSLDEDALIDEIMAMSPVKGAPEEDDEDFVDLKEVEDEGEGEELIDTEQWIATVIAFSSEYGAFAGREFAGEKDVKWKAVNIKGPPNVYPRYGDLNGAWAARNTSGQEFLEFAFEKPAQLRPNSLKIYETNCPGGLIRILCRPAADATWVEIWQLPKIRAPAESRILVPRLKVDAVGEETFVSEFRFEYDMDDLGGWCELDAVKFVGRVRRRQE